MALVDSRPDDAAGDLVDEGPRSNTLVFYLLPLWGILKRSHQAPDAFLGIDMAKNPGNSELAARISSYELAYRMQGCAPEAVDTAAESDATKKLYGLDNTITEPFGRQCLMARRLVERGVRFVQLFHGGLGAQNTDT